MEVVNQLKVGELMASWTVGIGDQDQVIHMWKYTGGYTGVDTAKLTMKENPVIRNKLDAIRMFVMCAYTLLIIL